MKNWNQKNFLKIIKKLDNINIMLKFKLGKILKREIFFNQKNFIF